jgi:HEAT repeat protein
MAEKQKKREAAEKAIRHFGTNALPMLIALLSSKDSKQREKLFIWSTRQPISQFRMQGASERRLLANDGFGVLGETAEPALPALIKMLKDRDEVEVPITTEALRAIGPKAFLPVINALTNQDDRVRIGALFALEEIAPSMPPDIVIPALAVRLTDTNARARCLAAFTLGKCGSAAKAAIPDLLKALNDPSGNVRVDAATALKQIDPAVSAKAAVNEI